MIIEIKSFLKRKRHQNGYAITYFETVDTQNTGWVQGAVTTAVRRFPHFKHLNIRIEIYWVSYIFCPIFYHSFMLNRLYYVVISSQLYNRGQVSCCSTSISKGHFLQSVPEVLSNFISLFHAK